MEAVKTFHILEAHQWFKNGDHPEDNSEEFAEGEFAGQKMEGSVVRYYRNPSDYGDRICDLCGKTMHEHGWIDNGRVGITVCPGDIVIKVGNTEYIAMKKDVFLSTHVIINNDLPLFNVNFQDRAHKFFIECFNEEFPELINDKTENKHRFIEESLEFVQSLGTTKEEVLKLVDYVFSRPVGDPKIEAGGVATTYSILCQTHGLNVNDVAEKELKRNYIIIDKIREKQRLKNQLGFKPLMNHDKDILGR